MTDFEELITEHGDTEELEAIINDFECVTRVKLGLTMKQFSDKIGVDSREFFLVLLEAIHERAGEYFKEDELLASCKADEVSH